MLFNFIANKSTPPEAIREEIKNKLILTTMKATVNVTEKNYKALIASNPYTQAFFTVDAESPEKALQSIKASNKEWRDCTIWIEYNPTGQRVEKIANEWEII